MFFFFVKVNGQSIWTNSITAADPSTANPYTAGQTVDANITVSGIGRGSGISASSASNRYSASGWNTGGSIDLNDYFYFTLTPNLGCEIDFTSLVYTGQASGTGPANFALRSSVEGYTANIGSPSSGGTTISLSAAAYQNITTAITFRLYGWNSGGGAGTWSVNDFVFNGTTNCGTPSSVTTGTVSSSLFTLSTCTSIASGEVDFISSGTYSASNVYTAELSNGSGSFSSPTTIGTLTSTANSGTIAIVIPVGTASGFGYLIRVSSSSPSVVGSNSSAFTITLTCTAPTATANCQVSGAISSGNTNGCGDGAACNLASIYSYFGTFCGGTSNASCSSCASVGMTTQYTLPSGCTAYVTAEFKKRGTGCSNSGMDSGDILAISNTGGTVLAQSAALTNPVSGCGSSTFATTYTTSTISSGCGNADGVVTMSVTGGQLTISGTSDRGDEIVTFTVSLSGSCGTNCNQVLPISLIDFYASQNGDKNDLFWKVALEEGIKSYVIEKSEDGIYFSELTRVYNNNTHRDQNKNYTAEDTYPFSGISYYRLSTIESDGSIKHYKIIDLDRNNKSWKPFVFQQNDHLLLEFKNYFPKHATIMLYDVVGRLIFTADVENEQTQIDVSAIEEGIYVLNILTPYKTENSKIIIQK